MRVTRKPEYKRPRPLLQNYERPREGSDTNLCLRLGVVTKAVLYYEMFDDQEPAFSRVCMFSSAEFTISSTECDTNVDVIKGTGLKDEDGTKNSIASQVNPT